VIGGDEMMHQVSPEDQLAVVTHRQAEWRAQSARERMARMAPTTPASPRPGASSVAGRGTHRFGVHDLLAHVGQLLHALTQGTGGRPKRSAH
jgi:hypothetical protein